MSDLKQVFSSGGQQNASFVLSNEVFDGFTSTVKVMFISYKNTTLYSSSYIIPQVTTNFIVSIVYHTPGNFISKKAEPLVNKQSFVTQRLFSKRLRHLRRRKTWFKTLEWLLHFWLYKSTNEWPGYNPGMWSSHPNKIFVCLSVFFPYPPLSKA